MIGNASIVLVVMRTNRSYFARLDLFTAIFCI